MASCAHHQVDMDGVDPAAACLEVPQLDVVLAHVLKPYKVSMYTFHWRSGKTCKDVMGARGQCTSLTYEACANELCAGPMAAAVQVAGFDRLLTSYSM
jgi:hypothetical protein